MKNLNYTELREESRTNIGSDRQIKAMNEMIARAKSVNNGKCSGHSHAMDILDAI